MYFQWWICDSTVYPLGNCIYPDRNAVFSLLVYWKAMNEWHIHCTRDAIEIYYFSDKVGFWIGEARFGSVAMKKWKKIFKAIAVNHRCISVRAHANGRLEAGFPFGVERVLFVFMWKVKWHCTTERNMLYELTESYAIPTWWNVISC